MYILACTEQAPDNDPILGVTYDFLLNGLVISSQSRRTFSVTFCITTRFHTVVTYYRRSIYESSAK